MKRDSVADASGVGTRENKMPGGQSIVSQTPGFLLSVLRFIQVAVLGPWSVKVSEERQLETSMQILVVSDASKIHSYILDRGKLRDTLAWAALKHEGPLAASPRLRRITIMK